MDEQLSKIEEVGVGILYNLVVRDHVSLTVGSLCQLLDTVENLRRGDKNAKQDDR